jgi:NADH:ubiquinone oxidoreductase subunit 6 (subunit J)
METNIAEWGIFGVLSIIALGGGLGVVINRNLFHSALFLMVSLFGVAGMYVMLSAPFLAAVQVLVYIGAIAILIIFAIMLTRRLMGLREVPNHQWVLALGAAGLAFLIVAAILILASSGATPLVARAPITSITSESIKDLGRALVDPNQYALPFILASVLLEAAMVGAIVVAREQE